MKIQTLCLLAAGSSCIIAGSQASAQISGISVASKPNEFGLLVCNVYAEFDVMGVNLLAIGGTPFISSYTVIDGTFYQSRAPARGRRRHIEASSPRLSGPLAPPATSVPARSLDR